MGFQNNPAVILACHNYDLYWEFVDVALTVVTGSRFEDILLLLSKHEDLTDVILVVARPNNGFFFPSRNY